LPCGAKKELQRRKVPCCRRLQTLLRKPNFRVYPRP
jgi:hypothetical protein